jgi:hypothetical protein
LGEWCSWIQHCFSLVHFSVLVNDIPGFFNSSCGFRQGDLLSPLLFVIFMRASSKRLSTIVDGGFLLSISKECMNISTLHISHLLFADDNLLFCRGNPKRVRYLHALLLCFEVVPGLRVNLTKSKLSPVGSVNNVDGLANILGCTCL